MVKGSTLKSRQEFLIDRYGKESLELLRPFVDESTIRTLTGSILATKWYDFAINLDLDRAMVETAWGGAPAHGQAQGRGKRWSLMITGGMTVSRVSLNGQTATSVVPGTAWPRGQLFYVVFGTAIHDYAAVSGIGSTPNSVRRVARSRSYAASAEARSPLR